MPAASSIEAAEKTGLPVAGEHPADLLAAASAVLGFVNRAIADCSRLDLDESDIYGLSLIIDSVQQSVDQSIKLL